MMNHEVLHISRGIHLSQASECLLFVPITDVASPFTPICAENRTRAVERKVISAASFPRVTYDVPTLIYSHCN